MKYLMQQLKLKKKGIVYMENAWGTFEELQGMKYLILLDEVCYIIDPDKIIMGIHNNQNDFKVVIASRYHRVCYDMGLHELSLVEGLSPDDAWNMFQATAGHLLSFPSIESIAKEVVKECDGCRLESGCSLKDARVLALSFFQLEEAAVPW
ncbi:probable disease resistance protein At5g63020 [Vitis riparia]|uniref:probable disease resistance protein At5g63020 n=1 Tax=Vitis riparia TaxID=96939 RepID=UPI00155A2268|nr:probable disease resistance protein At5g63020 [Vitis riparia]